MYLHEIVEYASRRDASASALVFHDQSFTYGELKDRIERVSGGFAALAGRGHRVAVLSENNPAFVDAYYAAPRAATILTLLNYRLHPSEWSATLEDADASVVVGERALLDRIGSDLPSCVDHVVAIDEARRGEIPYEALLAAEPVESRSGSADDVAWIIYTSGTTGRSKGAMLTHRSLVAGVAVLSVARPVAADDVYLFPFPLCHVAGYNVLAFHLHGRPVVLMGRFDADGVVDQIARHSVTQVSLAPTMIDMILELPGLESSSVPTLRGIGYGAAPIPSEVLRRGVDVLGCDFSQGYGMTELSGNAVFLDADDHRRACAGDDSLLTVAGRPSPFVSVRVVDDEDRDVPTGTVGEIVVRGDQLLAGYWNSPEATRAAFVGGWFHTGDMGRFDDRGYLSVVDRKKDVIVTGGENVSSREVEDVLQLHPAVMEVAVVGVPDDTWGENICAVVVARFPVEADELVAHVRASLAGYKKPKHVVFVNDLPRNHAGKVLKRELREVVPEMLD